MYPLCLQLLRSLSICPDIRIWSIFSCLDDCFLICFLHSTVIFYLHCANVSSMKYIVEHGGVYFSNWLISCVFNLNSELFETGKTCFCCLKQVRLASVEAMGQMVGLITRSQLKAALPKLIPTILDL